MARTKQTARKQATPAVESKNPTDIDQELLLLEKSEDIKKALNS